jgi:trans-aconitate methyltransferase
VAGDGILGEQVRYYRQRAAEYDATSYGDVDAAAPRVERIVAELAISGSVLELACGTGIWTRALAERSDDLTAVDASPEAISLARARCPQSVRFEVLDLFAWEPGRRFDLVFFGFWLSHVPTARVPEFFRRLGTWLEPGGRVAFVDEPAAQAAREPAVDADTETVVRELRDGSVHRLVKVYLDPAELTDRLGRLGWTAQVHLDGDDWLVAQATQATPATPATPAGWPSGGGWKRTYRAP